MNASQNPKRLWIAAAIVVVVPLLVAVAVLSQPGADDSESAPHPLVGTWTKANPQGPGTTRTLIFKSNGTVISRDIADSSGAILQDGKYSWRLENGTLVLRKSWRAAELRVPITRLSDQEFQSGDMIYSRVPDAGGQP
jgi:hypothetical protein